MMLRIFLLLVLTFSAQAVAQEPEQPMLEEKADPDTGPAAAPALVWPPPFQPSEDIDADSPVSFPTDI